MPRRGILRANRSGLRAGRLGPARRPREANGVGWRALGGRGGRGSVAKRRLSVAAKRRVTVSLWFLIWRMQIRDPSEGAGRGGDARR